MSMSIALPCGFRVSVGFVTPQESPPSIWNSRFRNYFLNGGPATITSVSQHVPNEERAPQSWQPQRPALLSCPALLGGLPLAGGRLHELAPETPCVFVARPRRLRQHQTKEAQATPCFGQPRPASASLSLLGRAFVRPAISGSFSTYSGSSSHSRSSHLWAHTSVRRSSAGVCIRVCMCTVCA